MNYRLVSINSKNLSKKEINEICKLKNTEWKYGIKSQMIWYKKNVKKSDLHNLFYIGSKLIGYTLLRKRSYKFNFSAKQKKYLLFDALVLDKKFRRKNLSNLLMFFNNSIIEQSGLFAFLMCKKKLINFYKKSGWTNLKKGQIQVIGHNFTIYAMTYNKRFLNERRIIFFIEK